MKRYPPQRQSLKVMAAVLLTLVLVSFTVKPAEKSQPRIKYTVSMTDPSSHRFHVVLEGGNFGKDTLDFRMPRWMPGYYQIMDYPERVSDFSATDMNGKPLTVITPADNSRQIVPGKNRSFRISYDVLSDRRFVACNLLDTTHAYIVPAATFMYAEGFIDHPVRVSIIPFTGWKDVATGLSAVIGQTNEFTAPDYDILYDCPLLAGNLEELPSFRVDGIRHRFIAYKPGEFNRESLIAGIEKIVRASADLMGDIPYDEYTFIGIGPGAGGIEHLNNTTISFSGNGLDQPGAMTRMLKFIAHEYFHNYNVKRIRPYELGPFDYDRGSRTNLLWFSEGASVYYEYLLVRRAGLLSEEDLIAAIESDINRSENDAGAGFQSLAQASYNTWSDGPFGAGSGGTDRSISYYEKGPVVSMILDFAIRNATVNDRSLDDVMRYLYRKYYIELARGFTDAEFQWACEQMAGVPLTAVFEYVWTTAKIDYPLYLSYAGLKLSEEPDSKSGKIKYRIEKVENPDPLQLSIYRSWSRSVDNQIVRK